MKDIEGSNDGMVGKARRTSSDNDFDDPNRHMKSAPHFVNASGKKHLAVHQVFKDYKEFNEVLKDYAIKKGFEFVKIKNSLN